MIHNGRVDYWPNMGRGRWGRRITMRHSPRYADPGYTLGYDPRRLLVGDVDGDGLADLVYVENNRVLLWINQSGNGWSEEPIVIHGTPRVTDMDAVRLVDFLGSGINGVLWSADATGDGRPHMFFLDFTGGVKPYLLTEMDNHMGATTEVEYRPSTRFYLEDKARREPWKTSLPFPVQVVARVEVIDHLRRASLPPSIAIITATGTAPSASSAASAWSSSSTPRPLTATTPSGCTAAAWRSTEYRMIASSFLRSRR